MAKKKVVKKKVVRGKTAEEWFNEGREKKSAGDFDGAIKSYDEAIKLNPRYTNAYNARGNAWQEKKEYVNAIKDYNQALKLDPNLAKAYFNRGNAWLGKKEYDNAIKDYNQALKLNPNYTPAIDKRGVAVSLQAAEGLQEQFKVDVDDLKKRAKEEKEKAEKAQESFSEWLIGFGIICAFFAAFIMMSLPTLSSNIYLPIAVASAFGIISFPFIWLLKQLKTTEARCRILSETFGSLAFIEHRIISFTRGDFDWQKAMYEIYITHRIKEGPEKLLLDLYQQKSDKPPATTLTAIIEKAINGKKD